MLVQRWASIAHVGLTLKQHWVYVSFELYLVISLAADINAVNLYSIGYCRPTRDRPTHVRFAVEWILKTSLRKKCLSVISREKNCLLLLGEKKNVMFSSWKEKNNLIRKKNHTPPLPVLNGPPLNMTI